MDYHGIVTCVEAKVMVAQLGEIKWFGEKQTVSHVTHFTAYLDSELYASIKWYLTSHEIILI